MGGLRLHSNGTVNLVENQQYIQAPALAPASVQPIIWTNSIKPVPDAKNFCDIAYDEIGEGAEYCECAKCHNCFSANHFKAIFETMAENCPLCRNSWTNWVIYTNSCK